MRFGHQRTRDTIVLMADFASLHGYLGFEQSSAVGVTQPPSEHANDQPFN